MPAGNTPVFRVLRGWFWGLSSHGVDSLQQQGWNLWWRTHTPNLTLIGEWEWVEKVKGKEYHTPWRVLVGCSSPLLRRWVHRWINHLSLWRMASVAVTPDLQLFSQSQYIPASRLVPNYTAWWQRHMCVNNLPKVVTWQRLGWELNSRPLESQTNALTITPPPNYKIIQVLLFCVYSTGSRAGLTQYK